MSKLLDRAFEKVQELPIDLQDEAARIMLAFAGADEAVLELDPAEEADLLSALAEVHRGEIASDDDVQAVFAKYRL